MQLRRTKGDSASLIGWWSNNGQPPATGVEQLRAALWRLSQPCWLLREGEGYAVGAGGTATIGEAHGTGHPIAAYVPPCRPQSLGDPGFCATHGLKYPYTCGAMANGIGSAEIVEAMARAGMLAFFGSAGLSLPRVEAAIDRIQKNLGDLPFGFNLIHSPNEPRLEAGVVDLYCQRGIRLVDASAYLNLTLPLIRYRVHGIHTNREGAVVTPNYVIAKVSRVEVARRFFGPPPEKLLAALVQQGEISHEQARMAAAIPVAYDLTAEADSGGHTDNQPFIVLIPTMLALAEEMRAKHGYPLPLRVGAAGGISTPTSAAAAFAMGASYIMTGSVNQACVEAGTSQLVREMLCQARQADVTMAPAADMFEMGVKVQVLKRGTMFAMRAAKLYEFYRAHHSLEELPPTARSLLEKDYFRAPLDDIWGQTKRFFEERDPSQIEKAERDPHYRMALVFRWYLGRSSAWANAGEASRKIDYQVWCGPAMGAFNEWVQGTFLEQPASRTVVTVAKNLLVGAAILTRVQNLRVQGVRLPGEIGNVRPMEPEQLDACLSG